MWSFVQKRKVLVVALVLVIFASFLTVFLRPFYNEGVQEGKSVKPKLVSVPKSLKPGKRYRVVVSGSRAVLRVVSAGSVLKKVRCKQYRKSSVLRVCRFMSPSRARAGSVVRLRIRVSSAGKSRVFVRKYWYGSDKGSVVSPPAPDSSDSSADSSSRPPKLGVVDKCSDLSEYFTVNEPSSASVDEGLGDGRGDATQVAVKDFVVPTGVPNARVTVFVDRPSNDQVPSTVYPASGPVPDWTYDATYYTEYGSHMLSAVFLVDEQVNGSGSTDVILRDSDYGIVGGQYVVPDKVSGADNRHSYINGSFMLRVSYSVFVSWEPDGESLGVCSGSFTVPLDVRPVDSSLVIAGPLNGVWNGSRGLAYGGEVNVLKYGGSALPVNLSGKDYMVDPDVSWDSGSVWDPIYANKVIFSDLVNARLFVYDEGVGEYVSAPSGQPLSLGSLFRFEPVSVGSDMFFSVQLSAPDGRVSAPAPVRAVKVG